MMKMIVHVLFYALCLITLFKSAYSVDNNNNNSSVFRATRSLDLSSQVESSDNFVRYFGKLLHHKTCSKIKFETIFKKSKTDLSYSRTVLLISLSK